MATREERLADLLVRWEEVGTSGDRPAVETFCKNHECTDLINDFCEMVACFEPLRLVAATEVDVDTIHTDATWPGDARYRPKGVLGHGGLGVVYLAEDSDLGRDVAVKCMRLAAAVDGRARERFIREAKLTGRLEHPGIVPVHALAADYYTMRVIGGQSMRDAIERYHKSPAEKNVELRRLLRAFVTACETMAYAHSRGVVHRDLKPHNIMLGDFGETLVIDWGLASEVGGVQWAEGSENESSSRPTSHGDLLTAEGRAMGTWNYMSPEQARGEWERVGPASDIFSLGATLYNALAGRPPYQGGQVPEDVLAGRFEPPSRLAAGVPKPLEAVCLKAMAHDPNVRYADARNLANDVERFLADEPVSAYRDPATVRLRRWAKRHRVLVATGVALLFAAIVALSAGLYFVNREKDRTELARRDTKTALDELTVAEMQTRMALAREMKANAEAHSINKFFRDQVLAAHRPKGTGPGKDVTLAEAVDRAEPRIAESFKGQPTVEADVRFTLGVTYYVLSQYATATDQLRRSYDLRRAELGEDHANTLASLIELANALREGKEIAKAVAMYRAALPASIRVHGAEGRETLVTRGNLGTALRLLGKLNDAEAELRPVAEAARRTLGPDSEVTRSAVNDLALVMQELGRNEDALKLFEEVHAADVRVVGPDEPETLAAAHNIGITLNELARLPEAEKILRDVLKSRQRVQGADHYETIKTARMLASTLTHAGKLGESEPLYRDTYERSKKAIGADHSFTLGCLADLGMVLLQTGKAQEGGQMLQESLEGRKRVLPADHPDILETLNNVGYWHFKGGRLDDAAKAFRESYDGAKRSLPETHRLRSTAQANLAGILSKLERYADAEPLLREAVELHRRTHGEHHPLTLNVKQGLGLALLRQGKGADAEPLFRDVYETRKTKKSNDPDTIDAAFSLAEALQNQGRSEDALPFYGVAWEGRKNLPKRDMTRLKTLNFYASALADAHHPDQAEPLARELLATFKAMMPPGHQSISGAQSLLGGALVDLGKAEEAELLLRECLAAREKSLPKGGWQVALARVRLGACLAALGKFQEAEPLMLQGEKEIAADKTAPPNRLNEVKTRLVALYVKWGKPAEAEKWKKQ
jgi:tetratricopeptide (TPR) repeat protein